MDTNGSNAREKLWVGSVRRSDIDTKERVNALLGGTSNFDLFSSSLKEIRKLRKKKRLNADKEEKLERHYGLIGAIGRYADKKTFRENIPQSEIEDWLYYVIDEIKSLTVKEKWIRTGRLDNNDYRVIEFCAVMLKGHVVPVYLAFKSEFFEVLANFIKARTGHGGRALPDVAICDFIGWIMTFSLETASLHFDKPWTLEKIFKKFEASGLLEQVLRCATVPGPVGSFLESQHAVDCLLQNLASCPGILTRKFKSGEPCGDTLKAILDGRDGSRSMQPRILHRLRGIARIVETMDTTKVKAKIDVGICFNCQKTGDAETRLSVCSGCRFVQYCSKECQLAHWKSHKLICQSIDKSEIESRSILAQSTFDFLNQNSETVFQALNEKCYSTGMQKTDLAVEVDFMPNEDGIIPAFHDPPSFRIVLIRDYISGQEIPEWLRGDKIDDHRRESFKDWVKQKITGSRSSFAFVAHLGGRDEILPDFPVKYE